MAARIIIGCFLVVIIVLQVVVDWTFSGRMDTVDKQVAMSATRDDMTTDAIATTQKSAHDEVVAASATLEASLAAARAQTAALSAQVSTQIASLTAAQDDARARLGRAESALDKSGKALDALAASFAALDAADKTARADAQAQTQKTIDDALVEVKASLTTAVATNAAAVAQVQTAVDDLRGDLTKARADIAAIQSAPVTAPAAAAPAATPAVAAVAGTAPTGH
jgi:chromosome segregation ATPase